MREIGVVGVSEVQAFRVFESRIGGIGVSGNRTICTTTGEIDSSLTGIGLTRIGLPQTGLTKTGLTRTGLNKTRLTKTGLDRLAWARWVSSGSGQTGQKSQNLLQKSSLQSSSHVTQDAAQNSSQTQTQGPKIVPPPYLSAREYEKKSEETLEDLFERLETILQTLKGDVTYSQGVLTCSLDFGTYVLNKQPANLQIWFSSPVSGPARFEWRGEWSNVRTGQELLGTLNAELKHILGVEV